MTAKKRFTNEEYQNTKSLWLSFLVATLGGLTFGYDMTSVNTIHLFIKCWIYQSQTDDLKPDFCLYSDSYADLSRFDSIIPKWSFIASLTAGASLISSIFGGIVIDTLGRKRTIALTFTINIIGNIIIATCFYTNWYLQFVLGRFISGLAVGSYCVFIPLYLEEIASPKQKWFSSTFTLFGNLGVIFAQVMGHKIFFGTETSWFYVILISIFFTLSGLIVIPFAVESPDWYLKRKEEDQAWESRQKLHRNSVRDQLISDSSDLCESKTSMAATPNTFKKLVKNKPMLKAICMLTFLAVGCHDMLGFPVMLIYSTQIYSKVGMMNETAVLMTIILSVSNLASSIGLSTIIEKVKRRSLILVTILIMTVCQFIIAFFGQIEGSQSGYILIITTIIYMASANAGPWPIPMMITPECLAPEFRAIAHSIVISATWLASFFIVLTYPVLELAMSSNVHLLYGFYGVLFLVWIWFRMVETKNRSFAEIQKQFTFRKFYL